MPDGGKPTMKADSSLAHLVAQGLRERVPHYFMREEYDRDGKIVEAWEGHPGGPRDGGLLPVVFCHEAAEPRRDWRERGIVPPRGFHPSQWRE